VTSTAASQDWLYEPAPHLAVVLLASLPPLRAAVASRVGLAGAGLGSAAEGALDDLLAAFDTFERHVKDSVEWLAEPAEEDEL
jgi:hypothetical protein